VHVHTGVKTHRIGPGRGRMVARVRAGAPSHASVIVRAQGRIGGQGRAVSREAEQEPKRGPGPLTGKKWHPPCQYPSVVSH